MNQKLSLDPIIDYFKHLSTDMIVAYAALLVGIILIIIGLLML